MSEREEYVAFISVVNHQGQRRRYKKNILAAGLMQASDIATAQVKEKDYADWQVKVKPAHQVTNIEWGR